MPLFILTETSAGYALLKAKDKKLLTRENLGQETETAEQICSLLKLKEFQKFESAAAALEEVSALVEGKVTSKLASLLDSIKDEKKASLAVADPKLANAINKLPQLSITPISDASTVDLYRAIRNHLPSLIPGLLPTDISTMSLGLSHSLSRHKLKFSPDKVDTMIVQAIALLDDLDKELNIYAMRVKEWYGWHFPEMGRIVNDNLAYARVILTMGMRTSAAGTDLTDVLPEEIETAVKAAAEVSMGTEITPDDLANISALAEQVVGFTEYRQQLSSYLSARMAAIAPNLTALVGDLVGARLISHAGSLMNLAKSPASTIQILGSEKALFRALKTKSDTPKYGLIYHASLIGQATGKNKGRIARVLAAKATIGLRVDALADWSAEGEGKGDEATEEERSALGVASRLKIERRLAALEGKALRSKGANPGANGVQVQPGKWEVKEARKYNPDADGLVGDEPATTVVKRPGAGKTNLIQEIKDVDMPDPSDEEDSDTGDKEKNEAVDSPGHANGHGRKKQKKTGNSTEPNGGSDEEDDEDDEEDEEDDGDGDEDPDNDGNDGKDEKLSTSTPASAVEASTNRKGNQKSEKSVKLAHRQDRKQRRNSSEQISKPMDQDVASLAKQAGLSVTRYKRKLERGEISFEADGTPLAISKKVKKKAERAAMKAEKGQAVEAIAPPEKKRKRDRADHGEDGKKEKSKKKKSKEV